MFRCFLYLGLILTVFSVAAAAQGSDDLPPLAATASLEETQKWLEKGIKKFSKNNFKIGLRSESSRIAEMKFEGCKLTYNFTKSVTNLSRDTRETTSNVPIPAEFSVVTLLNLADIDANGTTERPARAK